MSCKPGKPYLKKDGLARGDVSGIIGLTGTVGEITNMISGVARKKLEPLGLNISAAIPTVVAGKGHSIKHILGGSSFKP